MTAHLPATARAINTTPHQRRRAARAEQRRRDADNRALLDAIDAMREPRLVFSKPCCTVWAHARFL